MSPDPSHEMRDLETRMISGGWIMADGVSSANEALQYRRSHQRRQGARARCRFGLCGLGWRGPVGASARGHDGKRRQHQQQGQCGADKRCCERHAGTMRDLCLRRDERYGCGVKVGACLPLLALGRRGHPSLTLREFRRKPSPGCSVPLHSRSIAARNCSARPSLKGALKAKKLVGDDGLEPPTFSV